jgi:hypothetical protein
MYLNCMSHDFVMYAHSLVDFQVFINCSVMWMSDKMYRSYQNIPSPAS